MTETIKRRESYQQGTVLRVERRKDVDVWVFRYYRYDLAGNRERVAIQFSDVRECPTKAKAEAKAAALRKKINQEPACVTFGDLAKKYRTDGMPERECTRSGYRSNVKRLEAKWGDKRLDWMITNLSEVETWLSTMKHVADAEKNLSQKTKHNIKAILHRMFEDAMAWNYLTVQRNPIDVIRVKVPKGMRVKKRTVPTLTVEQYERLIADEELCTHVRVIIIVAMCTGMGISEILGLRWDAVDLESEEPEIHVQQSSVGKHQDAPKTDNREADVPLHPSLVRVLEKWRDDRPIVNGWVFGSSLTGRPFHADSLRDDHLQPAGKRVKIPWVGWHSFRHTYRAMLAELNEPLEVQQHLMRHGDIGTTTKYGRESAQRSKTLRKANARIIEMLPRAVGS